MRLENAILARRNTRTLLAQSEANAKSLILEVLWLRLEIDNIPSMNIVDEVSTNIYLRERVPEVSFTINQFIA